MYVRWKKRPMTRTQRSCGQHRIGGHSLTAVLVESRRVAGSPRQRFVAYLGVIQVCEKGEGPVMIGSGGWAHPPVIAAFWTTVSRKLDTITEPYDRCAIESMISAKVPRPETRT